MANNKFSPRRITDHAVSIDMAKEIAMIQRTDKGKQARQYFIQIEEAWNTPELIMARALKMAEGKIKSLQADNARLIADNNALIPKGIFADAVAASNTDIRIGELAKILKGKGIKTGEKRFFKWLRNNGYLIKRIGTDYNAPTQRSMELGLFRVKETANIHPDGHVTINKTTMVTGKGQKYFINLFLNELQQLDITYTKSVSTLWPLYSLSDAVHISQ